MTSIPVWSARYVVPLWRATVRLTVRGSHKPWLAALSALVILWGANVARAQTLVGLGALPNARYPFSFGQGVSADGLTVVGQSDDSQGITEAYIWRADTGMVGLGELGSVATAVSRDGSTVVGYIGNEAFIWRADTGIVGLGGLNSFATDVSDDGTTVVGYGMNSQFFEEAFIWTADTGMVGLGALPGALYTTSSAWGVSADGSTVVGDSRNSQGDFEAFIWTAATGMVALGGLPNAPYVRSTALRASADGSTVVGYSANSQGGFEGFIWTAVTGMVGLGSFNDALSGSIARDVSANGLIVVGDNGEGFILNLTPPDPADLTTDLIQEVIGLNIQHGIENSLDAKLDAALDALDGASVQNDRVAANALGAFINAVRAQSGKAIPKADAAALIAAAQEIIGLLQ